MSKTFRRGAQVPPNLKSTVDRLLHKGNETKIEGLRAKSLAVTSGKGGVGKTITATNLSIYSARKGIATALIDLDPLSDIATLLDLTDAEAAVEGETAQIQEAELQSLIRPVFSKLDLLFPSPKLKGSDREKLLERIYRDFLRQLDDRYELLVFDLPAGSEFEDNLVFLPFMRTVVLVTNPEPTAHAAAGAYIKRALDTYQDLTINIWHNRFAPSTNDHFDPKDIVGNYNSNVAEDLRIDRKAAERLRDLASVPEDPALNLLRGSPEADENVIRFLIDTLSFIHEERVASLAAATISNRSFELIRHFLSQHTHIGDLDQYMERIGGYLRVLLERQLRVDPERKALPAGISDIETADVFTAEQRGALRSFLKKIDSDPLRQHIIRVTELLQKKLQKLSERSNPFATTMAVVSDKAVDREISALLVVINRLGARNPQMVNQGGLLLFYFSLYKLFQSQTLTELIHSLIPARANNRGTLVRDRHRQIRNLVEGDEEYEKRYFKLLRAMHPIVSRQVTNIVRTFDIPGLLFRDEKGVVVRSAYVKLLSNFLHDTLYSGLSVIIGFPFRSAAGAFQEGAEKALRSLEN